MLILGILRKTLMFNANDLEFCNSKSVGKFS
jgi:hypothetical protein